MPVTLSGNAKGPTTSVAGPVHLAFGQTMLQGQQFDTDRYNIIVREDGSNGC
jgi:hypothetical protein